MFKFIHSADIHLDSPLIGLSQYENAPADRIRNATRQALTHLVDFAIEQEVDFLLIAGDLYDGDWKDYSTGLFFIREMRRLEEAEIPVFLISGNHDAESKTTKALTLPSKVHHFGSREATTTPVDGLPVSIHGQSFASPAVNENLAENYPQPITDHFNIGLLHTNLGDNTEHGNYAPCTQSQLAKHGYDYWALGHIHLREVHQECPHIVYPGNIQGRHAKETGPKGCYLVEVNEDLKIDSFSFHPLDTVRWFQESIDCSGFSQLEDLLEEVRSCFSRIIGESGDRLAAVRLNLTGHSELHGQLHADPKRVESECRLISEEFGLDQIWLEKVKIRTRSKVDLDELAQRDDLVALVVGALEKLDPSQHPAAVRELRGKLPSEALQQLDELQDDNDSFSHLKDDVSALVLHALTTAE